MMVYDLKAMPQITTMGLTVKINNELMWLALKYSHPWGK